MQLRYDADDLAAIDLYALMVLVAQHDLARDLAQRRVQLDPVAAADVGARQMNPDEALRAAERGLDLIGQQRTGMAFGIENEGGNHAGSGRAVDRRFGSIHRDAVPGLGRDRAGLDFLDDSFTTGGPTQER